MPAPAISIPPWLYTSLSSYHSEERYVKPGVGHAKPEPDGTITDDEPELDEPELLEPLDELLEELLDELLELCEA